MIRNKSFKNTHGFTLVELLAVIVVLAIVALIAFQAVLPLLTDARRNAFAIEANSAIESATTYVMRKVLTEGTTFGDNACVTIDTLINASLFDADAATYDGYVHIRRKANGGYVYEIWMTNGQYNIQQAGIAGSGETATNENIQGKSDAIKEGNGGVKTNCPTDQGWTEIK